MDSKVTNEYEHFKESIDLPRLTEEEKCHVKESFHIKNALKHYKE